MLFNTSSILNEPLSATVVETLLCLSCACWVAGLLARWPPHLQGCAAPRFMAGLGKLSSENPTNERGHVVHKHPLKQGQASVRSTRVHSIGSSPTETDHFRVTFVIRTETDQCRVTFVIRTETDRPSSADIWHPRRNRPTLFG